MEYNCGQYYTVEDLWEEDNIINVYYVALSIANILFVYTTYIQVASLIIASISVLFTTSSDKIFRGSIASEWAIYVAL